MHPRLDITAARVVAERALDDLTDAGEPPLFHVGQLAMALRLLLDATDPEADLAAGEADPANPYGSYTSPYTAKDPAEVAEGVEPQCGAEDSLDGHLCDLTRGHDGHHFAHGADGMFIASWPPEVAEGVEPTCGHVAPEGWTCAHRPGHSGDHLAFSLTGDPSVVASRWPQDAEGAEPAGHTCGDSCAVAPDWDPAPLLIERDEPDIEPLHQWRPAGPDLCPAQWGVPPETMLCSLPSGHDGNHATAEGIEWGGKWETAEPSAKDDL